jgi:hypothetical protein
MIIEACVENLKDIHATINGNAYHGHKIVGKLN